MEKIKPCALCGSMPEYKNAEQFYCERNGGMMLSWTRFVYVCPNCGMKSAPSYSEVCDEGRCLLDAIKLWNRTQIKNNQK